MLGVESEMTDALEQINRLNIQIAEYEQEIADIEDELEEANKILEEKQAKLEEAQEEYELNKEIVGQRLVAMYESSKTTYLDILMGSNDLSDFLSKYYLLEQIAEYDEDFLNTLNESKLKLEAEVEETETAKEEIETVKNRLSAKQGALEVLLADKQNIIDTLSETELALQEQLEQFEEDKKTIQAQLEELAEQNAIKASITPSESGYISPLLGKTSINITTGYNGYAGHTGVDFAVESGTEVLAVKAGTVVISDAMKNLDGSYRSYGEYVVIDHHDGTMTLYAHGMADSRIVEEGDEVEAGQVIMLSGSTGNSTGPHLHFEVRVNGKCVDPTPYLP